MFQACCLLLRVIVFILLVCLLLVEADTKVVENGFAEEVDEDDLEKLICEEVEDVSAESDSL